MFAATERLSAPVIFKFIVMGFSLFDDVIWDSSLFSDMISVICDLSKSWLGFLNGPKSLFVIVFIVSLAKDLRVLQVFIAINFSVMLSEFNSQFILGILFFSISSVEETFVNLF